MSQGVDFFGLTFDVFLFSYIKLVISNRNKPNKELISHIRMAKIVSKLIGKNLFFPNKAAIRLLKPIVVILRVMVRCYIHFSR